MQMQESLLIFQESFDAREFMDRVNLSDISDHFDMPEYKSKFPESNFTEPSYITPHAIVLKNTEKYSSLVDAYKAVILAVNNF